MSLYIFSLKLDTHELTTHCLPNCLTSLIPETGCGVVCAEQEFRCSGGRCILYLHRCDGHDDCGDFSDERGCVCAPGEFQCPGDQCVPAVRVCDGRKDCPSGIDEVICPVKGIFPLEHKHICIIN